jgi:hypothetical protein
MKKRLITATVLVSAAALLTLTAAIAAPGVAGSASATMRLSQTAIAVGEPAYSRVNVHARFSSVDSVCFQFTFVNDLLDPGELLRITPLDALPAESGPGFQNVGTASLTQRQLCLQSAFQPDLVALFADGKEGGIELSMDSGSVEISSVTVTVTGTPR